MAVTEMPVTLAASCALVAGLLYLKVTDHAAGGFGRRHRSPAGGAGGVEGGVARDGPAGAEAAAGAAAGGAPGLAGGAAGAAQA